ncbi:MAG: hypothetical protein K5695_02145 [Oscillospiraceae bacterium]|nr:hypothetical protein [Oscillospiraceae bacterium]
MEHSDIYGGFRPTLEQIKDTFARRIEDYTVAEYEKTGIRIYEHLIARVKSEDSMTEKCERKGLPTTPHSAMKELRDSIGIRIICSFIDDIYANIEQIRAFPDCRVAEEKDYIKHAKSNGYRSYHMILEYTAPFADVDGNTPGTFYIEIQLRTIAMAKLVEELLYISRLDAGKMPLHFEESDMHELIYDCVRIAQPLAEQKSCDIRIDSIDPDARAICDEEQLTRALSNLLVNAVYHCRTEVQIRCQCEPKQMMILIHNDGEQIPANHLPHLFDRFYTGHHGGSGIGLSIAMEVIRLHHGRLRMENDRDGVTCCVWIPYNSKGFIHPNTDQSIPS